MLHLLTSLLLLLCCLSVQARPPAVAFFYGEQPPWDLLQSFDLVVVDPGHVPDPKQLKLPNTRLAAYVSVGEIHPSRPYASQLPQSWLIGVNTAWGSRIIDQQAPGWPEFFTNQIIAPLWQAGYRDFFFDTLDSYHLIARSEEERRAQEAGLVALVRTVKARFPEARLIFNRGFEILPKVFRDVFAVAAESLFEGYDPNAQQFRPVPVADHDWLLAKLEQVRSEFHLPVIVIDYLPAAEREKARLTAQRIAALGFIPWVATPGLDTVGIGLVEAMPRKVLAIHEPLPDEYQLRFHNVIRRASMPLNYLGYSLEARDPHHLPSAPQAGRLAGVLVWLSKPLDRDSQQKLNTWLTQRLDEGVPIAVLGDLSFLFNTPLARRLGIFLEGSPDPNKPVLTVSKSDWIGFERTLRPHPHNFVPLRLENGEAHLTLAQGTLHGVGVAITPWGGFALAPYVLTTIPTEDSDRWLIDPFLFFEKALRLPEMPVPDVTTETGRRILMVHMDGDGFPTRAEMPGRPYASEVLRDRIVRRYRIPMTLSVIEGEISPQGVHPNEAPALEKIARDIFAEPHVEIASHSFSHPFIWHKVASELSETLENEGYRLNLPGYRFDLEREIEGSIRYIESRLAPPGKKVRMFLWTGDCNPGTDALARVASLGLLNMNGGDTLITRSLNTLTAVEGLGIARGAAFHIFAPNQNENVYTNRWRGPFYGFRQVIETFELTERPRRLKPIDIYFHTYIASKPEALKSLEEVFDWALKQETTPLFASEYAEKVLDFQHIAVARTITGGWRVRGAEKLRTLRWPLRLGFPVLSGSIGIAGFRESDKIGYLHLAASAAEWYFSPIAEHSPRLVSANGRVLEAQSENSSARWKLSAHVPLSFTLINISGCSVNADGKRVLPMRRSANFADFRLSHATATIEAICGQ